MVIDDNIKNDVVTPINPIETCRLSLIPRKIDLNELTEDLFLVNRHKYQVEYYRKSIDAERQENEIEYSNLYILPEDNSQSSIFVRIVQVGFGCVRIYEVPIIYTSGEQPEQRPYVEVCGNYIFPELGDMQSYYIKEAGQWQQFKEGDILERVGAHQISLIQQYTVSGCYEETSYVVTIQDNAKVDKFPDVIVQCQYFTLHKLSLPDNAYYTEPKGKGTRMYAGQPILEKEKTIYIYAKSDDAKCSNESHFTVTRQVCLIIPKGISPNGDGLNDSWDLSNYKILDLVIYNRWGTEVYSYGNGYTNQWKGQNKAGDRLPNGTYFYVFTTISGKQEGWVQVNY